MEYEIELKLLTHPTAGHVIESEFLTKLDAKVERETLVLTNHYYDTKQRTLRKNDIGLRIRGNNGQFEQTLKTSGKTIGGLHQRPEYNVDLDISPEAFKGTSPFLPKLELFPAKAWPNAIEPKDIEPHLEVLFTTHFKREVYLIHLSDDESVELVWDHGEITSGDKKQSICELELELKKGHASQLFALAKQLIQLLPTSIGIDSKAARGYALLDDRTGQSKFTGFAPYNAQKLGLDEQVTALEVNLRQFQYLLAQTYEHPEAEILAASKNGLTLLQQQLSGLSHFHCKAELQPLIELAQQILANWPELKGQENSKKARHFLQSSALTQIQLDILHALVAPQWSA